ncbi:MAG: fasciclin domain-containing protein [Prevotella sp.]|nr:fasciclin domain-containing protein [Prevotella sp.]
MKKTVFCLMLALVGMTTACVDKNEAVDADSKPSWLGGSIYQELKNPEYLTGTFNTYLRLVDDLGYAEVLNRTGSKTVFPANDEAFQRFFQSNDWGVSSYAGLSDAQKKMLLYTSMLDNALLVNMLSNVSNTSSAEGTVTKGMAVKHQTQLSATDSIQLITDQSLMPQNNVYWDKYRDEGRMYLVSDATRPMMVHFTREHMLNNGITTDGDKSDFAILTGTPYEEGMAYIFNDRIIQSDITCQNGYIHQMQDVIVPPGNMAQVLRNDSKTSYFSRILDYFCAPFENPTVTSQFNAAQLEKGLPTVDMIYERRYLNNQSAHAQRLDPDNNIVSTSFLLDFDPGWNQYSPLQASGGVDYTIADISAMFVPTDQAVIDFFTEGGDGAYLIDLYGKYTGTENNVAHLAENLDSLHSKRPAILTSFVKNLMKPSFTATVPSKFETIQNDANEYMGITTDLIDKKSDGKYNITIANNGVVYKMNELIAPDEYQSVMAPASVYPDMSVMNWAVKDDEQLGVSHHYYLMAMKANFAFFIPDDEAFEQFYIDPIYLGHKEPRALKFSYDPTKAAVQAVAYAYNPATGEIGEVMNNGGLVPIAQWKSLFVDILNYHTVVLDDGETFGTNNFYKTKHGGEIRATGATVGSRVMSGQQIDNGVTPSTIENVYNEKNGQAFRIDHVIQAPRNSVSKTLQTYPAFSEFYSLCSGFTSSRELMKWAGISDSTNVFGTTEQDAYIIFTSDRGSGNSKVSNSCLDENVKMFNTFNYTLYAPNNAAMEKAYAAGLPRWADIQALYEQYANDVDENGQPTTTAAAQAMAKAKKDIGTLCDFARYHFQSTSVYADNVVQGNRYNSLSTDELGLAIEMRVSGGGGQLQVTDATGATITVNANDASKKVNLMARDYWFDRARADATSIYTSSFCVVHEIDTPLNSGQSGLKW